MPRNCSASPRSRAASGARASSTLWASALLAGLRSGDTARAFGVLRLTLRSGAYDWKFLPAAGATFSDSGTARCHGAP